jgi:amino acid adenylation domain-containing protein
MNSAIDVQDAVKTLSAERRALLAARLKRKGGGGESAPETPSIVKTDRKGELPLSFTQRRLWFLDQLNPGMSAYNVLAPIHLKGALDVAALEKSVREIVRRHETLRTAFPSVDGRPVQTISPDCDFTLSVVSLGELGAAEREREGASITAQEVRRPFDLARGPLVRAVLLELARDEHALIVTMHHIISDGWSMGVLVGEFKALYKAYSAGEPSPLEELPVQYVDYVRWKLEQERTKAFGKQLSYWKKQLAGAPASLDLPTDRPRPPVETFDGARQAIKLPAELSEAVRGLNRREGVTMFMTLLAAYVSLLHRYSGQDDITVGTPIANRNHKEIEKLIGFFSNTLALRADLSGNPSFRELLGRMREVSLAAYSNQDLPFERLVEELNPERHLSRQPLFQVMFVFQNTPTASPDLPGLTIRSYGAEVRTAKFDLTFTMEETGEGVTGSLEYSTALFDRATVARMLRHFQRLLEGAVADPDCPIGNLPMLTPEEEGLLLKDWNATDRAYPFVQSIRGLFEAQAAATPDATAAVCGEERITYGELNLRANRLAHYLKKRGVGPDTPVGVCLSRSFETLVAVLGVLKAGGAYAPLDPAYPAERVAYMLEDSHAPLVLTEERLLAGLAPLGATLVPLDANREFLAAEPDDTPEDLTEGANLAYIIYTSGSTGRPKGVAMTQAALINLIQWQRFDLGLDRGGKTLQLSSLSFDASFNEMFSAWYSGGTIVLIPEQLRRDPEGLLGLIAGSGVERLFPPYAALQQMAEAPPGAQALPSGLRDVLSTAEQLQVTDSIVRMFRELGGCRLHNEYGPSETHVVTAYTLEGEPGGWRRLPPIGRPIANTQIYLLDARLMPVPPGAPGELYVGGISLARGYLNRPDLTAERFLPDPFGRNGGRLYRTGDLARYLPDGNIECLGRKDQQVKIRGYRIEPGEIEAALMRYPSAREAAVTAREDRPGDRRLVAYVVLQGPQGEKSLPTGALYEFLRTSLPEYMLPSAFVEMEKLPLTPSGKIDRKALPAPDWARPELGTEFVPPAGPAEQVIAGIWSKVLNVERVGREDNFFELGGHSLLVTQVVARMRNIFQVEIPIRSLFESPTVEGLAAVVAGLWGDPAVVDEIAATALEIERLSAEEVQFMLES